MVRPVLLALAIGAVGWSIIAATMPDAALNPNGIAVKRFWQAVVPALSKPASTEGGRG